MKKIYLISYIFLNIYMNISCQNIITFFIKPANIEYSDIIEQRLQKISKSPDKADKYIFKKEFGSPVNCSGIYATYKGNISCSDLNGQIVFKREAVIDIINLLVTQDIDPILINPYKRALVSNFIVSPGKPFSFYTMTKKNDSLGKSYWLVEDKTEEINLAKFKKIGYNTITLIANPDSVVMPVGNISAIEGENLILPDVFITPKFKHVLSSLKLLKRRKYFRPVNLSYKFPTDKLYEAKITN